MWRVHVQILERANKSGVIQISLFIHETGGRKVADAILEYFLMLRFNLIEESVMNLSGMLFSVYIIASSLLYNLIMQH